MPRRDPSRALEAVQRDVREALRPLVDRLDRALRAAGADDPSSRAPDEPLAEVEVEGARYVLRRVPPPAGQPLSPRERQIALLVKRGLTNKAIAFQLQLSRATVATYLRRVFIKLNVDSRVTLAQHPIPHVAPSSARERQPLAEEKRGG